MEKNLTKKILLKQHNKVTEARYEMSALEKNIVYMFLNQLKDSDPLGKKYFVSVQELKSKLKELGEEISLEDIQQATFSLIDRVYHFEEESGDQVSLTLFASVTYTDDSDLIAISISRTIRPYLFDLKYDFTSYHLDSALSLRSIYAKRIYEMLSQHKDAGVFKISVQELRERLKLTSKSGKKEKLTGWSTFEKTVLGVAKKEINEKTELDCTYTLKKTGPKYTDIEFRIVKKESSDPPKSPETQLELGF